MNTGQSMYLRRLELQGYKSFADKTHFEFVGGITAIVGPNGSGKSNIADAVRWALGEQSYRTLRAKRTDDMIFTGSSGRRRMGMAQAYLQLDNVDGDLPTDFSEVTVGRRAYRSGENEYLLNGSQVLLREISELLAQGGLDSTAYSVIGQGLVDAALSLRPDERRELLDKAAGIHVYRAKREDALAKLEETYANLTRVRDIVGEIGPRLHRLEKRAQRAEQHAELSEKLEELLLRWYSYRWAKAQEALKEARARETVVHEQLEGQRHQSRTLGRKIEELREKRKELRAQMEAWREEQEKLRERREELRRSLAVSEERLEHLAEQKKQVAQETSRGDERRQEIQGTLEEATAKEQRLTRAVEDLQAQLEAKRGKLASQRAQRQVLEEKLAEAQERKVQLATALAETGNSQEQIQAHRSELRAEGEERGEAITELRERLADAEKQATGVKKEIAELERRIQALETEKERTQEEIQESSSRQGSLEERLDQAQRKLEKLEAKRESMSRLRRALDGHASASEAVLDKQTSLSGIVGRLTDLMQVPTEYEAAVEAALGSHASAIVVETWNDAQAAVAFLKESDAGKGIFLPMDLVREIRPATPAKPAGNGVIGIASQILSYNGEYGILFKALLGDVLIVRDLSTVRQLKASHNGIRFVTPEGDLVDPAGTLRGGSKADDGGLLTLEREWKMLPERIAEAEERLSRARQERGAERRRRQRLEKRASELESEANGLRARRGSRRDALRSLEQEKDRLAQELAWRREAEEGAAAKQESLSTEESSARERQAELEAEKKEITEHIQGLKAELHGTDFEGLQEGVASLRTDLALAQERQKSQEGTVKTLREDLETLERELQQADQRQREIDIKKRRLQNQMAQRRRGMAAISEPLEHVSDRISSGGSELQELEEKQTALEERREQNRKRIRSEENAYARAQFAVQRAEDQLRNLREQIESDFDMVALDSDLPTQLTLDIGERIGGLPQVADVSEGLERRIKELRRELQDLGSVDPDAAAEYKEVQERHTLLTGQAQDLEEAAEDLRQVIAELDEVMEERFETTYSAVAEAFSGHFARLFDGGEAKLILTNTENPTESGIQIAARPPGKRSQGLTALSGGERSLTGIALIFALVKVSPTPFCVLDEVDAMLDEANIGRFTRALKGIAEETQIIIITHNRGTIETADTIYGISMDEDGVSSVISLRPDEA